MHKLTDMKSSHMTKITKKIALKYRKTDILKHYKMTFSYVFHQNLLFEENTYMSELHLCILDTNNNKGQNKNKKKGFIHKRLQHNIMMSL